MSSQAVTSVSLGALAPIASGKVRELFKIDDSSLLMVATDRISAYDEILSNGIPDKGAVLCQISDHWFKVLSDKVPGLKHHLLSMNAPSAPGLLSPDERAALRGRCMQVRSLQVLPLEVIVRGYITGSAWSEYEKKGTVHGIPQPAGLQRCQAFPGGPIYTPSTKAPVGEKDENISPEEAKKIVGEEYAQRIEALALDIYKAASAYALDKGIVIADTKMEFGIDEATDDIVLIDEVLTPDSSRFWAAPVTVGKEQDSFDKQYVRNYLTSNGLKGKPGVVLPDEVVENTANKYREVFKMLTGQTLQEALAKLES